MGKAIFKFNNGNFTILCSDCRVIVKTGAEFTEREWDAMKNLSDDVESVYCDKCKLNHLDEKEEVVENKETSHLDDIKNIEKIAEVFYYQLMDEFAGAGMNYKDLAQRKKGFVEGYLAAKEDKQ